MIFTLYVTNNQNNTKALAERYLIEKKLFLIFQKYNKYLSLHKRILLSLLLKNNIIFDKVVVLIKYIKIYLAKIKLYI